MKGNICFDITRWPSKCKKVLHSVLEKTGTCGEVVEKVEGSVNTSRSAAPTQSLMLCQCIQSPLYFPRKWAEGSRVDVQAWGITLWGGSNAAGCTIINPRDEVCMQQKQRKTMLTLNRHEASSSQSVCGRQALFINGDKPLAVSLLVRETSWDNVQTLRDTGLQMKHMGSHPESRSKKN